MPFPSPALRPPDVIGRARMRLWTKQLDEGLHADTGVLSTSIAVRHLKLEKGADEVGALINNVPEPAKRQRVHANITRCDQPICMGDIITAKRRSGTTITFLIPRLLVILILPTP
jgi:hypothetical protein